jgi:hypothetical protein
VVRSVELERRFEHCLLVGTVIQAEGILGEQQCLAQPGTTTVLVDALKAIDGDNRTVVGMCLAVIQSDLQADRLDCSLDGKGFSITTS